MKWKYKVLNRVTLYYIEVTFTWTGIELSSLKSNYKLGSNDQNIQKYKEIAEIEIERNCFPISEIINLLGNISINMFHKKKIKCPERIIANVMFT